MTQLAYTHGQESNRRVEAAPSPQSTRFDFDKAAFDKRLAAVKQARNPLLEAARVLLRAQANMADHTIGARYCLCTALDEVAMHSEWGKDVRVSAAWVEKCLATTFLEDNKGGERIYLLIGRLLENAADHIDLLQVIYRILSLGFMGRYRHDSAGDRKHLAVRTRLYNEIITHRGLVPLRLSFVQQLETQGQRRLWFYDVPLWFTGMVLSAILLGMFGWYKYQLLSRSAVIQEEIGSIAHLVPSTELTLSAPLLKALPIQSATTASHRYVH